MENAQCESGEHFIDHFPFSIFRFSFLLVFTPEPSAGDPHRSVWGLARMRRLPGVSAGETLRLGAAQTRCSVSPRVEVAVADSAERHHFDDPSTLRDKGWPVYVLY
jgi:hypothetical protein